MKKKILLLIKDFKSLAALSLTTITASPVFGQSTTAYEVANCNANFLSCSAGGYAAPIGDLGGSFLELVVIGTLIAVISLGYFMFRRKAFS